MERFANIGASVQTNNSAEEFAAYIRSEYVRWGEVIKKAGIKAE